MTTPFLPKINDNLNTWLDYLTKCHKRSIHLTLDRIKIVAQKADLFDIAPLVITVAGTNGKGSTCKIIETTLLNLGLTVGVFSSPHLLKFNERVRINNKIIEDQIFINAFFELDKLRSLPLTFFEFNTLASLKIFKEAKLDIIILEVGMGGRFDATNIIDADIAVITSIGLDHQQFLGQTREEIALTKAGIFRPNQQIIIGEPNCPQILLDEAKSLTNKIFSRVKDWQITTQGDKLTWQSKNEFLEFSNFSLPEPNIGTAVATLMKLPFKIEKEIIIKSVAQATLPGRIQVLNKQNYPILKNIKAKIMLDVAHNGEAAHFLASKLKGIVKGKIWAIFGCLADKDSAEITHNLASLIDTWHCVTLTVERGQTGEELSNKIKNAEPQAKVYNYQNVKQAFKYCIKHADKDDLVLVFGSFYTVAAIFTLLEN